MKEQKRYVGLTSILLSILLMVCMIYHEPLSVSSVQNNNEISNLYSDLTVEFKDLEAKPEAVIRLSNQVITESVKNGLSRRNNGRIVVSGTLQRLPSVTILAVLLFLFAFTHSAAFINIQFRGIISHIQSQIGL